MSDEYVRCVDDAAFGITTVEVRIGDKWEPVASGSAIRSAAGCNAIRRCIAVACIEAIDETEIARRGLRVNANG